MIYAAYQYLFIKRRNRVPVQNIAIPITLGNFKRNSIENKINILIRMGAYKNTNRSIFRFAQETHNSMQNFTVNLFLSFWSIFDCCCMALPLSHWTPFLAAYISEPILKYWKFFFLIKQSVVSNLKVEFNWYFNFQLSTLRKQWKNQYAAYDTCAIETSMDNVWQF